MKHRGRWLIVVMVLSIAGLPDDAHAVDGVVLITQTRALAGGVTAGDAPGFPVTISLPGSYRLASDLTVPTQDGTIIHGIEITSSDVTLDLNGFSIINVGNGEGTAVSAFGQDRVTLLNGRLIDWIQGGFSARNFSRIEGVHIFRELAFFTLISLGDNGLVRNNSLGNIGQAGIACRAGCLVVGNVVRVVERFGFFIELDTTSAYTKNVFLGEALLGGGLVGGTSLGDNLCNGTIC